MTADTDLSSARLLQSSRNLVWMMAFLFVNPFVLKNVYSLECALIGPLLPYLDSCFSCREGSECVRQDSGR